MSAIDNVTKCYNSQEEVIKFYDYFKMVHKAAYNVKHGKVFKILTPKQIFQRLLIVLAHVKTGSTSENLLNEIREIIEKIAKKTYNNINEFNKVIKQNGYYIYEFWK